MIVNFLRRCWQAIPSGIVCLAVIFALFGYIASVMGTPNMLNTIMKTAHITKYRVLFDGYLCHNWCSWTIVCRIWRCQLA